MIVLAELLRQLADRRRLPGPVDADDEDHRRFGAQVEARRAAQELRGLVAERGAQLAGYLARLEPLDELGRRRDPDVGRDQRLLEPLPCLVVARVERRRRDLLGQRPAALPERVTQAREEAGLLVRRLVARVGVAEKLAPAPGHRGRLASGACSRRRRSTSSGLYAAFADLVDAGARALSAPHDWLDGTLRVAWVADPDDNPVELVERRS